MYKPEFPSGHYRVQDNSILQLCSISSNATATMSTMPLITIYQAKYFANELSREASSDSGEKFNADWEKAPRNFKAAGSVSQRQVALRFNE